MKKLLFLTILSVALFVSMDASAQFGGGFSIGNNNQVASYIPLHLKPQAERETILLEVSKEALLRHGPGYYKDTHQTVIEDMGNHQFYGYEPLRMYKVTYIYDKNVEQLAEDFAAEVFVKSNDGKVRWINFGNTYGVGWPDGFPEEKDDFVMSYQQAHEMPGATVTVKEIGYEIDSHGNKRYYIDGPNGALIPADENGNPIGKGGSFEEGASAGSDPVPRP